jgi:hypothetical protein
VLALLLYLHRRNKAAGQLRGYKMFTNSNLNQTVLLDDDTTGVVVKELPLDLVVIEYHDENGVTRTKAGKVKEVL